MQSKVLSASASTLPRPPAPINVPGCVEEEPDEEWKAVASPPFQPIGTFPRTANDSEVSICRHQQSDSERDSDQSSNDGYGLDDEGSTSNESKESGEEEDEEVSEKDIKPRQLLLESPVSRNAPSGQPQTSYFHDEDTVDVHWRPVPRHVSHGVPRHQSSSSRNPLFRSFSRPQEPPGSSRTFSPVSGQAKSTSPVGLPRNSSIRNSGSIRGGASLHRTGSLNNDSGHYRSSSITFHGDTERFLIPKHARIASDVVSRERQPSTPASAYRPDPVQFSRNGSVGNISTLGRGPDLHHAGTLNSNHYRSSRLDPYSDTECLPTQRRPRIPSSIVPRERRASASATPHSPSPVQFSHSRDVSGIGSTRSPAGLRAVSWISDQYRNRRVASHSDTERGGSLNVHRHFRDFNVRQWHNSKYDPQLPPVDGDLSDEQDGVIDQFDDLQSMRSLRSRELEQRAIWLEAEARRKEEEASRKEEEARRLEEKARQSLEEAKHFESGARQVEASAKMREAAAQKKEAEAKRTRAEAKKREAEAQMREAEVQTREAEVQRREEEVRLREGEARRLEERARRSLADAERLEADARQADASAKIRNVAAQKKEAEAKRKEAEAKKREAEAQMLEADIQSREAEVLVRETEIRRKEEVVRQREDEVRRLEESARQAEAFAKMHEAEAQHREAEARSKDEEASKREEQAHFRRYDCFGRPDALRRAVTRQALSRQRPPRAETHEESTNRLIGGDTKP
ncbi:hypothetical protein BC827DRAFT_235534 [Russula dissimulans]|nr:hypothetical protein BC827DRAFT_235534 [Russula dissimulans]